MLNQPRCLSCWESGLHSRRCAEVVSNTLLVYILCVTRIGFTTGILHLCCPRLCPVTDQHIIDSLFLKSAQPHRSLIRAKHWHHITNDDNSNKIEINFFYKEEEEEEEEEDQHTHKGWRKKEKEKKNKIFLLGLVSRLFRIHYQYNYEFQRNLLSMVLHKKRCPDT